MSWTTIEAKREYNKKWMREHWVMTRERKDRANQLSKIRLKNKKVYEHICEYCGCKFNGLKVNRFCSRACGVTFLSKSNSKGWKITSDGYKRILMPNHPLADKRGFVSEHRYIASKIYRVVGKGTVVHHIDENRLNNSIYNLLVLTRGEHTKLHHEIRRLK